MLLITIPNSSPKVLLSGHYHSGAATCLLGQSLSRLWSLGETWDESPAECQWTSRNKKSPNSDWDVSTFSHADQLINISKSKTTNRKTPSALQQPWRVSMSTWLYFDFSLYLRSWITFWWKTLHSLTDLKCHSGAPLDYFIVFVFASWMTHLNFPSCWLHWPELHNHCQADWQLKKHFCERFNLLIDVFLPQIEVLLLVYMNEYYLNYPNLLSSFVGRKNTHHSQFHSVVPPAHLSHFTREKHSVD